MVLKPLAASSTTRTIAQLAHDSAHIATVNTNCYRIVLAIMHPHTVLILFERMSADVADYDIESLYIAHVF